MLTPHNTSFFAIIYCFLSTCLGIQIRRSDLWEAISLPSLAQVRERDRQRRRAGNYEMDDMDGMGMGVGLGMGAEQVEMMRRNGPGRGLY